MSLSPLGESVKLKIEEDEKDDCTAPGPIFENEALWSDIALEISKYKRDLDGMSIPAEIRELTLHRTSFTYLGIPFVAYLFDGGKAPLIKTELSKNLFLCHRNFAEVKLAMDTHNFVEDEMIEEDELNSKRKRGVNSYMIPVRKKKAPIKICAQMVHPDDIKKCYLDHDKEICIYSIVKFFSTIQEVKFFVEHVLQNTNINFYHLNNCLRAAGNLCKAEHRNYNKNRVLFPIIEIVRTS